MDGDRSPTVGACRVHVAVDGIDTWTVAPVASADWVVTEMPVCGSVNVLPGSRAPSRLSVTG